MRVALAERNFLHAKVVELYETRVTTRAEIVVGISIAVRDRHKAEVLKENEAWKTDLALN